MTADNAGNLFVADAGSTIRKVALATAKVTTPIGVAGQVGVKLGLLPAGLNQPWGVAVLGGGGIVIVDSVADVVLLAR